MELGLSSCGKPMNEDTFCSYIQNDIKHMEISPQEAVYDNFDYRNAEKLAKQFGINLWSYHLQFSPFKKFCVPFNFTSTFSIIIFPFICILIILS